MQLRILTLYTSYILQTENGQFFTERGVVLLLGFALLNPKLLAIQRFEKTSKTLKIKPNFCRHTVEIQLYRSNSFFRGNILLRAILNFRHEQYLPIKIITTKIFYRNWLEWKCRIRLLKISTFQYKVMS